MSRGEFLKSLKKSIPGMVLGGGVAVAAQKFLGKIAAASGPVEIPAVMKPEITLAAEGIKIDFITKGPPDGNRIALTFDDGPTPGVTDRILDELQRYGLQATFFMIGERIAAAPDLALRVLAEGHEVGNHTFTHPKLTTLSDRQFEAEIRATEEIMAKVLNHRAGWFRPPYGELRQNQAHLLARKSLGIVLWSVDSEDWSQPGEAQIAGKILDQTKPGSIILCHDKGPQTANALRETLDRLLERDFQFATLSTLLT